MRIICITVNDDSSPRIHTGVRITQEQTRQHFAERGVDAQFFRGIHASRLGIKTELPYEVDAPGSGFNIGAGPTGCWLSHRAAWAACLLLPDELFFIIEDDAKFPEDWRGRVDQAVRDAGEFDILYVGSCCANGKQTKHVAGNVYEVRWPFCTHGYIVQRSALVKLIETQDAARLYAPVDISLVLHTLPTLKAFTVKPRILDQFNTEMPE